MSKTAPVSPLAVSALLAGTLASVATTCGPPEPWDTGYYWYDTGYTDTVTTPPPPGITEIGVGTVELRGAGDVAAVTVHAQLSAACLAEVPEYSWGYPTGWAVLGFELAEVTAGPPPDTAAADTGTGDTGTGDTAADTGADTSTSDTDTGADTSTSGADTAVDTGADTSTSDTDTAVDTGDTSTTDTSAGDTGDTATLTGTHVYVTITRDDGASFFAADTEVSGTARDSGTDEYPWASCGRDEACDVSWTYTFALESGTAVDVDITANARLRMCSSGEPFTGDLTITVE